MSQSQQRHSLLVRITDALRIPRVAVPHIRRFGWGGTLVTILVVLMIFGVSPITIITGTYDPPRQWTSRDNVPAPDAPREDLARYMEAVHLEARRGWVNMFLSNGIGYTPATISLITPGEAGPCGWRTLASGPRFCERSNSVVVDLDQYGGLALSNAEAGHFAQAYLLAHAYGEHVQSVLQRLSVNVDLREGLTERQRPAFEHQLLLQPHCFAGIWAAWAGLPNLSQHPGVAALVAQAQSRRYGEVSFEVRPTISEQVAWFTAGFDMPVPRECDPFANLPSPSAPTLASGDSGPRKAS